MKRQRKPEAPPDLLKGRRPPFSLSDGSIGDAVPDTGPNRAHRGALGTVAERRPRLGGSPPHGSAAPPAYVADASGRDDGRLETVTAGGWAGDKNASNKCGKKHRL